MSQLILASASPRRREMLAWTGLEFLIRPVDADEHPLNCELPQDYVSRLARTKAESAANGCQSCMVLAADTTVADDGLILGKPVDTAEARAMLQRLRGHSHQVFTALAIYLPEVGLLEDRCCSQVPMRAYTHDEIEAYIASGDPMDKAGAYAIQNRDFQPVAGFKGCFANVMGLPLCHLTRTLQKAGIETKVDVPHSCQHNLNYACPVYQAVFDGQDVG